LDGSFPFRVPHRPLRFGSIALLSAYCLTEALASNNIGPAPDSAASVFTAAIIDMPKPVSVPSDLPDALVAMGQVGAVEAQSRAINLVGNAVVQQSKKEPAAEILPAPRWSKRKDSASRAQAKHTTRASRHDRANPLNGDSWSGNSLPLEQIATADRRSVVDGCKGRRWSGPDAAGAPVLICD
jgi:hypothetical protein